MRKGLRLKDRINSLKLLSDIGLVLGFSTLDSVLETMILMRFFLEKGDSFTLVLGLLLIDFGLPVEDLLEVIPTEIGKIFDEINHNVMLC